MSVVTDGVVPGRRERVLCAIGLLILGSDSAVCGIGSVFGGIVKLECGTSDGVDSTLGGVTTLGGGVSLGGGGGGAAGSTAGGVSAVLFFQILNRSRSLEMADNCSW